MYTARLGQSFFDLVGIAGPKPDSIVVITIAEQCPKSRVDFVLVRKQPIKRVVCQRKGLRLKHRAVDRTAPSGVGRPTPEGGVLEDLSAIRHGSLERRLEVAHLHISEIPVDATGEVKEEAVQAGRSSKIFNRGAAKCAEPKRQLSVSHPSTGTHPTAPQGPRPERGGGCVIEAIRFQQAPSADYVTELCSCSAVSPAGEVGSPPVFTRLKMSNFTSSGVWGSMTWATSSG